LRKSNLLVVAMLCMFTFIGCSKVNSEDTNKSYREDNNGPATEENENMDLKQEVQNFKLEGFSKTGDSQWSVKGQFANILDPDVVLKSLQGKSTSKQVQVSISAERGIYNKNTRCAELKGNVVAVLSDGGRIYMDTALWNATEETISTESPVRIEHSGIVLEGVGGLVKPQKEWAVINQHIRMCDQNSRIITCDGPLEVDYKNKQATLNNNVVIIDPEQGKMSSDKVIAYFDPEKKEIDRIEWIGNVKAEY